MDEPFDLIVIGAGPAGLAAGAQAARRGARHVVLDSSRAANTIHRYQRGKLVMDEPTRLPLHPELPLEFRAGSREEVLSTWEEGVRAAGVNLRSGPELEVTGVEGAAGDFHIELGDGSALRASHVVVAIGLQGNIRKFDIPGAELPHVHYQLDDPAEHSEKRVVVVGAGDAALENALGLVECGARVHLVTRDTEFPRAKDANRLAIENAISRGTVTHQANATVCAFEPGAVVLESPDGRVRLDADLVIGRLGAEPPRAFLEKIGIDFPAGEAVPTVSESFESNVPGIHLIGSLIGSPLIKQCMNQGYEVVEHILGHPVTPADHELLSEKFSPLPGTVDEVLERIRQTVPAFRELTKLRLREFLIDSSIETPESGSVFFERNDFSDSVYAVLDGQVEMFVPQAVSTEEKRIPLGAGEYFGEFSLLSGRRRTATARAGERCTVIEIPRLAMTRLIGSSEPVRRELDATFLRRMIENLAPDVSAESRDELTRDTELRKFQQGEVLLRQGEPFSGMYLIRRGSVMISREFSKRERVVNYVQAIEFIGEYGAVADDWKHTATARAAIYTEALHLPAERVHAFLARHPQVRERFEESARERLVDNLAHQVHERTSDLFEFLAGVGMGDATNLLLIDESLCIQCDNCETACARTHGGVSRLDRGAGPIFGTIKVPTSCRHCENPRCMIDCPPDALRRQPNGEITILESCIGCGNCARNCPYDVIQMAAVDPPRRANLLLEILFGAGGRGDRKREGEEEREVAVKCDLCHEIPIGQDPNPGAACVAACPTGAVIRVDPSEIAAQALRRDDGDERT